MASRLMSLNGYENQLIRYNLKSREDFKEIITKALDLIAPERDLAEILSTSRTTVDRWKNGNVAPSVLGRKAIIRELRKRVSYDITDSA